MFVDVVVVVVCVCVRGGGGGKTKTAHRGPFQVNVERRGMSEQAHGETKWRLGELARLRVHHGHASALSLRSQQENSARPARTTSTFVVQKIHSRHALRISFSSRKDQFFFVVITVSVDGKEV